MSGSFTQLKAHKVSLPMRGQGAPDFAVGRLLMRHKAIGSWYVRLPAGMVRASRRAFDIFDLKYTEDPVSLKDFLSRFTGPDRRAAAETLMRAIENKCGFEAQLCVVAENGSVRHVECFADVELSDKGVVTGVYGTVCDITATLDSESTTQSRSAILKALMKRIPAAIAVLDTQMNYVIVSEHWASGHGTISANALAGMNHYQLHGEVITDEIKREHKQVLAGATLVRYRDFIRDADGEQISQKCVLTPWYRSMDEIGGMIIALSNVDERYSVTASSDLPTKDEFSELLAAVS